MAIDTCLTTAGRLAFLQGRVKPEHTFMIALYTDKASLGKGTKVYSPMHEVTAQGYRAMQLASPVFSSNDNEEAIMDFPGEVLWDNVTISAAGVLIYDKTLDNLAIVTASFGKVVSSTNDRFKLEPSIDLIRFA